MASTFESKESPPAPDREEEGVLRLVRRLMDELATLFRQEMALATAELSGTLRKIAIAFGSIAIGTAVLFAGFVVLLLSAVLGLAMVVAPWLAALLVGVVVSAVGVVMVMAGRAKIDPAQFKPSITAESLRRDKETLSRRTP